MKLLTWRKVKTSTAVMAIASMAILVGFVMSPIFGRIFNIEWWIAWPVAFGGFLLFSWRYGRLLERSVGRQRKATVLVVKS